MRCPGQDRAYWKDDAASETPCPKCGYAVEFFKDESSGRCPKCGHRFGNPKVSFDCAKWCSFAEQCLGFRPQRSIQGNPGEGALVARLIREIKSHFAAEQPRIADALTVFQCARELLAKEGGDPRIVSAAALVWELDADQPRRPGESAAEPPDATRSTTHARRIMQAAGLEEDLIACVCRVLESCRTGNATDTVEFQVVSDARLLAHLSAGLSAGSRKGSYEAVGGRLRTKTGKRRAQDLLESCPGQTVDY
ncbi:MAG: hypothetical protein JXB62_10635 [Pirellulales bacterium]|nr:hypothetical protein [Pirellulales bacterium]